VVKGADQLLLIRFAGEIAEICATPGQALTVPASLQQDGQ
jgi:hypothetical protein